MSIIIEESERFAPLAGTDRLQQQPAGGARYARGDEPADLPTGGSSLRSLGTDLLASKAG